MKNVIFDSQILTGLMNCERLTDYQFNQNLIPITGKGNPIECGSLLHEILKVYYQKIRAGEARWPAINSAKQAGEVLFKEMQNVPLDNVVHPNGHVQYIGWNYILATMDEYWEHYSNESWTPIEIEKVVSEVIFEDSDVRVLWKAKLDMTVDTNQGIYAVDHKTMKQRRDTISLNNQFMGQCVVTHTNGVIINKVGWQKTLKGNDKFTRPMMCYSSDRLDEWKQIVGYYAKYYIELNESGYWPPRFSFCDKFNGCLFRGVCESDRSMRDEEIKLHFITGEPWEPLDD